MHSIFVDSQKHWKLGSFEYSCNFENMSESRIEVLEALKSRPKDKKVYISIAPFDKR